MTLKESFIIISEIKSLYIPCSMKINILSYQFYLYPRGYSSYLQKLNEYLRLSREKNEIRLPPVNYNLFKREEAGAYIVFAYNFDVSIDSNQLTNNIYDIINPFLNILSFLCSFIFTINRIFIFKKVQNFYKFWRMISHSINNKESLNSRNLVIFTPFDSLENYFNDTKAIQKINDSYYKIINEFLFGKLKTSTLEIKLMLLWNTLEHLTAVYCKDRKLTKVLNKEKLGILNDILDKEKLKLKEEDIIFPGISIKELNKRLLKIPNYVPVRDKVNLMISDIYKEPEKIEDLILLVKEIRDKMYHYGIPINDLLKKIKNRLGLSKFDFQELIYKISEFQKFIEEIFLRIFKLIPDHLQVFNFHRSGNLYEWKVDPSILKKYRNKDLINDILKVKEYYTRKKTYGSIIQYIEHTLLPLLNSNLYENEIEGVLKSDNNQLNVKIVFLNNFLGDFYGEFEDVNDWRELKNIYFRSKQKKCYILEFRFYSSFEYPIMSSDYFDYLNSELKKRLSKIEFIQNKQEKEKIYQETFLEILKERKYEFNTLSIDLKKITNNQDNNKS